MSRRHRPRSGAEAFGTWLAQAVRDAGDRAAAAGCDVTTIAVVIRIALHMNRQGIAKPSYRYIGEALNLHRDTVGHHVELAEAAGVFTIRRRDRSVNLYHFGVAAPLEQLREVG